MNIASWKQKLSFKEPLLETQPNSQVNIDQDRCCGIQCPNCKLTFQERLAGWLFFFLLGFLLSIGSTFRLIQLLRGNPAPFARIYSLGNITSLCSTGFFVGPIQQFQSMLHKKRRISAIVYLLFIVLTITFCYVPHLKAGERVPAIVICITIQFLALCWYTLSFIPYGRRICKSICRSLCCPRSEDIYE